MKIAAILKEEGLRAATVQENLFATFTVRLTATEQGDPILEATITAKGQKPILAAYHDLGRGWELAAPNHLASKYGTAALGFLLWMQPQMQPFLKREAATRFPGGTAFLP